AGEPDERARRPVSCPQHEHVLEAPDEAPPELVALRPAYVAQRLAPACDRAWVELRPAPSGLGPLSRRVRKDVQVGEGELFDARYRVREVLVRLAGETSDDVGAEPEPGARRGQALDQNPVHARVVRPSHRPEHARAAA